jgi:hypothetical protein
LFQRLEAYPQIRSLSRSRHSRLLPGEGWGVGRDVRSNGDEAKLTQEDVELLREYVALLERAKQVEDRLPSEETMNDVAAYVHSPKLGGAPLT